jgi:hypothetical protein
VKFNNKYFRKVKDRKPAFRAVAPPISAQVVKNEDEVICLIADGQ